MARLSGITDVPEQSPICLGCHATAAETEEWERVEDFRLEDGKVRIREERGIVENGNPMDYLVHMVPIRGPLGKIRFIVEMDDDDAATVVEWGRSPFV